VPPACRTVVVMATRTTTLRRAHGLAARHPQAWDAALGLIIAVWSIVIVLTGPGPQREARDPTPADFVVAVVAFLLVALRRRWPIPVFAAAAATALATVISHGLTPVLMVTAFISAATVAVHTSRRTAWITGGTVAALFYLGAVLAGWSWTSPEALGMVAWTGMAVAIGDAVRSRKAYVAAIEERALRAERSRDEEARRRVIEERLRIARELHDVVAHHIAMINVQAGVAAHVLRDQPDQAEEALAHVRKAARTVLDETSTLLGVLRRPDEPDDDEPTRGLARLGGLLDSLAGAGLHVEHRQEGDARELPAAVDLAAYRIVQEALTNAHKHGSSAAARVCLAYSPAGLDLTVSNPVASNPVAVPSGERPDEHSGGGHGLIGMRERAAAIGGTLQTVQENGTFLVKAFLPAPASRA
jgi:signal transduction histidine kinase